MSRRSQGVEEAYEAWRGAGHGISRRDVLRLAGVTGIALTAGALTGCGQSGGATGGSARDAVQFTAWSLQLDEEKETVKQILAAYEKDTGVDVSPQGLPYDTYLDQLILRIRGGDTSGVAQVNLDWISTLAATGKLLQLGDATSGRGYTDAALRGGQVKGVQYGLPWTTASIGMIGNQQLLDQAGITSTPSTIEEFEEALDLLKAVKGVTPYAAMTAADQLKDIVAWILTFGGTVLEDGKVTLGDEGSVQALEWYKSLLDRGYIAPDMDRFAARTLFAQGKVGYYDDAPLARASLAAEAADDQLADALLAVPRPVGASGQPEALLWGRFVVVLADETSESAVKFAQYLTSDTDATLQYFEGTTLPPTTEKALASPEVQNDAFIAAFQEDITAYASPSPFWVYPSYSKMDSILAERVQAVLAGSQSAKDALTEAQTAISSLI